MMDRVLRRAFFDDYAERIERLPPSLVQYRLRFSCPCCGYPTLRERGRDEICYLCSWEDDGQDDHDADDVRHGPNRNLSLTEARENFVTFGLKNPPWNDRRIGGPDRPEEKAIKEQVIGALDEMMSAPAADHEWLWAVVAAGDRKLYELLKQMIQERADRTEA